MARPGPRGRTLQPAKNLAWMMAEARRARQEEQAPDLAAYAEAKAARRPWLTIQEAAYELGLSDQRISGLCTAGVLRARRDPNNRLHVRVAAQDVYNYQPRKGK